MEQEMLAALSEEDRELLEQIQRLGAATPIELAVKTLRQPDEVRPELERLQQAGLVKVRHRHSGYERNIYLLTSEGRHYANPGRFHCSEDE